MSDRGINCASDMVTGRWNLRQELEAYKLAAQQGCKIHMRLYLQWKAVFGPRAQPLEETQALLREVEQATEGRVRTSGIKIFADGAIGSATAAIYGRYAADTPNPPTTLPDGREFSGQLIYSPQRLNAMVKTAADAGYQVAVHAIGDYATDLVMDAFEATEAPARHRLEHGMLLSDAQIERMAKLGCFLTFQPEFLMRLGHAYRRQLGPERASKLKRARSVIDAGIRLSFNSDRPIVDGDPVNGIRTAVCRPEGFDPSENVSEVEAIRAYTLEGARVNGDEGTMGDLMPGSLADWRLQPA
jgi:predicted amidohydrolase YtcJ